MTTFQVADEDVVNLVASVLADYHPDLVECGVRIGVLMAYNPEGDAIKSQGFAVLACVRVVGAKDRVTKGFDVEMLIDQRAFEDELTEEQRVAVIDHECLHLNRVPNTPKAIKAGELAWKTDDRGRPKIRLRKGDVNVGDGFAECISRHGDNAVEFLNIRRAMTFANGAKERGEQANQDEEKAA